MDPVCPVGSGVAGPVEFPLEQDPTIKIRIPKRIPPKADIRFFKSLSPSILDRPIEYGTFTEAPGSLRRSYMWAGYLP